MSNNKQSSVELFIEQLEEKGNAWENVSIRRLNISIDVSDYMELKIQAKATHKSEIIWAHGIKMKGVNNHKCVTGEQYYEKTFGGSNE